MKFVPIAVMLALAPFVFAQDAAQVFQQAPPHIDQALRERVNLFYQAHVDGHPRLADEVVHEDSKDAFFAAAKPDYKSFEIVTIKYLDNFTRAQVVVAVEARMLMMGLGMTDVKAPITSLWKYDNGQWWWYVPPPEDGMDSPFGRLRVTPEAETRSAVEARINALPSADDKAGWQRLQQSIQNQVKVKRDDIELLGYEPNSQTVEVLNSMPGPVTLSVRSDGPLSAGYSVSLEKEELGPGEQTTLNFHIDPINKQPKPTVRAILMVQPTGAEIPITVHFASEPGTDPNLLPKK